MPGLALILSGAVSLGSFEAGVLTELLFVLDYLAQNGRRGYTLDVITGASAGAMTAALVARAVMNDFDHRRFLHDAWVKEIDIETLTSDVPAEALLSRKPVDRIAAQYLTPLPHELQRPARFAPKTLHLAFTLSNMNGVDYELPDKSRGAETFVSTFFADRRRFHLTPAAARQPETWDRIREAALGSGDFPFAFSPVMVFTDPVEYAGARGALPDAFCCVDGGVFNNEPIREAVQLALEADGGELDGERVFLLVDANLNRSLADPAFAPNAGLPRAAQRLFQAMHGELVVNDWLRAQRVNNEIAWRDTLLDALVRIVREQAVSDPAGFVNALRVAAREVVGTKQKLFPTRYDEGYLEAALERTARRHRARLGDLDPMRQEILRLLIFLLNNIAGLDKKTTLNLGLISADPGETAGDRLAAFGGFFDQRWREYDFRLGREKAHELLPGILGDGTPYPRETAFEDLYAQQGSYKDVTMADADRRPREKLRDAAVARVKALVNAHAPGPRWLRPVTGWVAGGIVGGIVKKKVSDVLELG